MKERSNLARACQLDSNTLRLIRYRIQDELFLQYSIEIEQLNKMLPHKNDLPEQAGSESADLSLSRDEEI